MATTTKRYLLYCDAHGRSGYFIRLGLGIFWECGPRDMAREFSTRRAATQMMQQNGKHRQGWRVLIELREANALPASTNAVDPHAQPSGTLSPREKEG